MQESTKNKRIRSLGPLVGRDPWLLMLGSAPSQQSLAKSCYYGHPRNHFWPLMSVVVREELPNAFPERYEMLKRHGVALWDSIESCERAGSLDSAIKNAQPNDIAGLLAHYPSIGAVACNGQKAHRELLRHNTLLPSLRIIRLPSSSPVPRKGMVTLEDKLPDWLALREFTR